MSTFAMAKRQNGVTQGSLQKTITISGSTPRNSSSGSKKGGGLFSSFGSKKKSDMSSVSSQSQKETQLSTFCILVGVKLICHENVTSMRNGNHPIANYSLVGVSPVSDDPTSFRAVTDKGTHLLCKAPTKGCRDVWLSALNAGLEYMLLQDDNSKAPITPQYGLEERVDLTNKCALAQGVLEHCYWMEELYATHHQEMDAMLEARRLILKKLTQAPRKGQQSANNTPTNSPARSTKAVNPFGKGDGDDNDYEDFSDDRDSSGRLLPKSHTLSLEPISNHVLGLTLESPKGVALQRRSPTLRSLCAEFQQGMIGVLEFLELLEAAIGIRDPALVELKKQAFRVAGDMGTALKILYEQCLSEPKAENSGGAGAKASTELLRCILEFFLDLVTEEDELNTLAFFWPQIANIHLQMLPPRDTLSLQKIELVEDFLLTVASKHSIHLAIELVWSHTADLEDALSGSYHGSTTTFCGWRKSAVLRFLCELESLLFDFDSGWGGGSVTVGQFLSPSDEQIESLKSSMARIQKCRLAAEHDRLSRSHRLDKVQRKNSGSALKDPPEALAKEAVRVANNADYLSSHLAFTKRLCDVAELLRFLPLPERKPALCRELAKLNASGTMGGDPTNVIKETHEGHTRVVRIPIMEGHVFRSKARTPVLLLVETIEEAGEAIVEEEKEERQESSSNENIGLSVSTDEASDSKETPADDTNEKDKPPDQEAAAETAPIEVQENKSEESKETSPSNQNAEETTLTGYESEDTPSKWIPLNNDETEEERPSSEAEESAPTDETETGEGKEPKNDDTEKEATDDVLNQSLDQPPITEPIALTPQGAMTPVTGTPVVEGRKVGFDEIAVPELAVSPSKKVGIQTCLSTDTVGSVLSSSSHHEKIPRHALRRFDSPKTKPKIITPQADKMLVENLMTGVIAKQLHLPNLVKNLDEEGLQSAAKEPLGLLTTDEEQPTESETEADSTAEKPEKPEPTVAPNYSKMKNLGTFGNNSEEQMGTLHKTGGTRREVLTAIMTKGMSGGHIIAEQAATGAKRHLQDLERRVAVEALLTGDSSNLSGAGDGSSDNTSSSSHDETRNELLNLGIKSSVSSDDVTKGLKSEDDETLEAIRLLLIQYRVAKSTRCGEITVSPKNNPNSPPIPKEQRTIMHNGQEFPEIDAGDVDSRLVGCGVLPPAVLQALTLWKGEMISNGELLELVKKDLEFEKNLKAVERNTDKLNEDSAFWGRFAFGERWAEKRSRIAASSPDSVHPGWDLTGIIVKSNDDLRQESFVMQLIELCHEAFQEAELELWLLPYRIISTGRSTGIMGLIRNAMSFDGLKKRPGYNNTMGIRGHLQRMTEHEANPGEAFQSAQKNFVRSLAAYSLLSYMFLFKDRHNGNIMLDTDGHVIHIDFGFVFGIAPGGNFSLEMTTPFKLTEEMIDVMDGLRSSLFSEFVTLFCCGFLALQAHYNTFVTLVEVTSKGSTFPCFDGRDASEIIQKMEERFCPDLNKEESIAHVLDVIKEAVGSYGTKQYDYFQYMSQGIAT